MTVEKIGVTEVTVTGPAESMTVGDTMQLTASVKPENADDLSVEWSSSDEAVATVSATGLVTALKEGSVIITATSVSNPEVSGTYSLTVETPVVKATSVTLSETTLETKVGEETQLEAKVLPVDAQYKSMVWESSNPEVASVDQTGLVSALRQGEAVITVTVFNEDGTSCTASCAVTVRISSGIGAVDGSAAKITVKGNDVTVLGVGESDVVRIFDLTGFMVACEKGECTVTMSQNGVYVVSVGNKSTKIRVGF